MVLKFPWVGYSRVYPRLVRIFNPVASPYQKGVSITNGVSVINNERRDHKYNQCDAAADVISINKGEAGLGRRQFSG